MKESEMNNYLKSWELPNMLSEQSKSREKNPNPA